jgi:hypothetical protein
MSRLPFLILLSVLALHLWTRPAAAQESSQITNQNVSQSAAGTGFDSPSLWLESGLAYREGEDGLEPRLRVGVRSVYPLSETVGLYGAFALDGSLTLDLGAWYSFLPTTDDLFGFRAYAGAGLTTVAGSFGVALSAAATYDLSPQTALLVVYTHRPLVLPDLGQAFDLSFGVRIAVPE